MNKTFLICTFGELFRGNIAKGRHARVTHSGVNIRIEGPEKNFQKGAPKQPFFPFAHNFLLYFLWVILLIVKNGKTNWETLKQTGWRIHLWKRGAPTQPPRSPPL